MNIDIKTKFINKSISQDSSTSSNKKEFELIKEYLKNQPEQINKLNDLIKTLNNVINSFIEHTKNYSSQIELLAMKIIPNYFIGGQLMQSIQAILLFYSEDLNNLINRLKDNLMEKQEGYGRKIIEQFKEQKKIYSKKIQKINSCYKTFRDEINLYQEYLVNREYEEHKKNGCLNRNYDDSIIIKENEENNKKEEIGNNKEITEMIDEDKFDCPLNEFDNKSELVKSNKEYIKYINESNDILNKIRQFLDIEKTNILKTIFNLCHYFVDGLLTFTKNGIKNFENQTNVLNALLKKLIFEEKNTTILTDFSIKLKYLEIYYSHDFEKANLQNNTKNNVIKNDDTKKNKKNEINNRKKNDKVNKVINSKNKHTVLTLDNLNIKHKNDLFDRKTVNSSNKPLNSNYLGRMTFNSNQSNDIFIAEKEKKFESMVKELNREEIINIFEKIKEANITLNESDIKLIENEVNFKKIKEILTILFIYPEKYKEENKNELIKIFEKDKKYILYSIKVLNDYRTKGKFFIQESTYKYFGEILKYLNNFTLSNNDMEIFKYIVILSQTYYYYSEKDKKKVFLFSYIKDYPGYSNPQIWDNYLKELIKHELKNLQEINIDFENINLDNVKKDEKEKLVNCFFSNLLTTSKAMTDFNLDKKFVREFVEKNKAKYYLSQEQIDNICLLNEMSLKEEEEDVEEEYNNKQKQNKNDEKTIEQENKIRDDINNSYKIDKKEDLNLKEIPKFIENKICDKKEIISEKDLENKDERKKIDEISEVENHNENNNK